MKRILAALTVLAGLLAALALTAAPALADSPTVAGPSFITVDDGTQIAVCISYPAGFKGDGSQKWPALFETDGYGGCGSNDDPEFLGHTNKYVVVYAQVRGTGCSGGQLDLFSQRSALDGKYIIDNWIEKQPWSNGIVGITGHSYSGLMGYLTAETQPHIRAAALSGLIDDLYRSILYPGGVFNEGFPVLWGALLRPALEFSGNAANIAASQTCAANQLQHEGSDTVPVSLLAPVYTQTKAQPDTWAIQHSLINNDARIDVPIEIHQQYQDEQTGPRGGYILWQHVPADLPKRLVLSNGQHNPNDPVGDKGAWLDCWLIDKPTGLPCPTITGEVRGGQIVTRPVDDPANRVVEYFEGKTGGVRTTPYLTSDWPAPETDWRLLALGQKRYVSTATDWHATGTLGLQNDANTGQVTFAHAPDEARYEFPFPQTTAISGPILADLKLKSTAPITDVWADVIDLDPATGAMEYLQRGVMRSSFRAVDASLSDRIQHGPLRGTIYRPYHDYLKQQLMLPGRAYDVPLEIFPLGHVFQAGHVLVLDIHAPPASDPLSTYAFEPKTAPALNTILPGSTLLLPVMPTLPPQWPTPPSCAQTAGYVCFTPAR